MTPEERRARNRAYYEEHRAEILAGRKSYYQANRDKLVAYQREYASRHRRDALCKILKEHKQALADDPERLSTDFILKLVQGES